MKKIKRFQVEGNNPELEAILQSALGEMADDLNALFELKYSHEQPYNENIDKFLFNEFNCHIHYEFELYSMAYAINMSEEIFFDLFLKVHEYIQSNYTTPLSTVNKLKGIFNILTDEQRIFLSKTLCDRLETGDDWNNQDHPQALTILHHLYIELIYAQERFNQKPMEPGKPIPLNRELFCNYIKSTNLTDSGIEERDLDDTSTSNDSLLIEEKTPLTHARICLIRIYNQKPITTTNKNKVAQEYGLTAPNAGRVLLTKYNELDNKSDRLLRRDIVSDIEEIRPCLTPDGLFRAEEELTEIKNRRR